MSNKQTNSKRYTDEELKAKAIVTMRHINEGQEVGAEIVMAIAQRTGMHPQIVVNEIQRLANIQL